MVRISDNPHKMFDQSLHLRNDSEEIGVFEAAKYFSGGTNEIYPSCNCSSAPLGVKDGEWSKVGGQGNGISLLDKSLKKGTQTVVMENQSKDKKHKKQPSSPGGRIAKIMNALFNQTSLKKGKSVKDDDEITAPTPSPDWRRKRRSSINIFQPQHKSSQSFHSGFRTPPPAYAPMTSKASSSCKDFRCYSDHKEISPYSFKNHRIQNPSLISIGLIKAGNLKHAKIGFAERFDVEDHRYSPLPEGRQLTKYRELADDGADSDSSSDLFDLPNCDGNLCSCDLPVYETTHIQSIRTRTR